MSVWGGGPLLSAENCPHTHTRKVHSGASGPQKLPKWTPTVTLWGTSGKSGFAAIYNVFSTFEGPRLVPKSKSVPHWKTLPVALFRGPRAQKGH